MDGDQVKFIEDNIDLVRAVAGRLRRRAYGGMAICGDYFDDLVGYGMFGLIRAAEMFDPAKSSFRTYATLRIKGAICDGAREMDWMTRGQREKAKRGEDIGFCVVALEDYTMTRYSDDEDDELDFLMADDAPGPLDLLEASESWFNVKMMLAQLPEQERRAMTLYYIDELPMRAIGELMGVTESRISQLHTSAIKRLRKRMEIAA